MSQACYTLQIADQVATLMIDRPEKRNALDIELIETLIGKVNQIAANPDIHCLVITGGGEKSFVAGADIKDMIGYTPEMGRRHVELGHQLFSLIEDLPIPTIAAINGYCLGGGLEFASACDIRVCSANARFGQPEIKIAMPCTWGGTDRLQRLIGQSRTKYLMLTGKLISAEQAEAYGLVSEIYPDLAALRSEASTLAKQLASHSPVVARTTKFMIRDAFGRTSKEIAHRDEALFAYLLTTHDAFEGLQAFLDKRPPRFEGR